MDLQGRLYFRPKYNYCIYGIKYYHNEIAFDNLLYFNDPSYPWHQEDITHTEFEKAAQPLCDDLGVYADWNAQQNALYYAAWVMTTAKTYIDIFFLCCKPCPLASTVEEWRIHLKLQFLIRRQYNLMKNYILHQVPDHPIRSYIDESYYITNRIPEINVSIKTCNTKNFKKVPITTNNNVCFVTASDVFERSSLHERQTEKMLNRAAHEIIDLGPYNAAEMKYMNELQCRIQHNTIEDNECVVWMTYDKYGYECCCYGDLIGDCQDRISNSILVGIEQQAVYNKFMVCAIPNRNNTNYTYEYDSETKKVTFRGKMEDILDETRTKNVTYCLLYVEILNMQYKYYTSTDEFQANELDSNVLTDEKNVGCHYYANWDIRLMDIVKTRCIQIIPSMDMCLKNAPLATDHFEALCCCNHQTFCNYNGLILGKLNANKAVYYCKYNSQYQYLFNDLLLIDQPPSRSCLLHYIDNSTLSDMDFRLPNNNFILFQQPGNAFYPIDFSYALLEDGKCRYIEVEINFNYTNAQSCQEAIMFETNYMPLKIFACRCRTEISSKTPCDEQLAAKIQHFAESWPLTNLTQCIQYDQQRLGDITYGMNRMFLTYTSYCYTEMTLMVNKNELKFYVSAGEVTHAIANNVGKYLDHIAYAMWLETGSTLPLCASIRKRQAYCFCRSYNNYADACNGNLWERAKLQKILMGQEFDLKIRKEYPNMLSDYLVEKGETWCHYPNVYGTLDVNMENEDVITRGKCAKTKRELQEFNYDRIFCVEIKALENECFARVEETEHLQKNHLLCCCKSKCETVGFIIQTLAKEISDSLDTFY
uniref:G_PROTEIN_RECEP_F2_4 domain-containing protein n=1 Tax=Elaeophora elaphi TaxID=1147741 RepID=A0A158Q8V5_9BILA